jgi:hypothetical protein
MHMAVAALIDLPVRKALFESLPGAGENAFHHVNPPEFLNFRPEQRRTVPRQG